MPVRKNNNKAVVLDEVLTQFVKAYVQGERPDLDDFIERCPQYEAQIRRRVRGLREIDALFDSLVQSEGNNYIDTPAEHNLVGQKIGGFEIVEMIGRGGMGVVYLAQDTRLKRSVAIKSMPPQWKTNSAARIRFRREAELLALLNHPNIAVIHDIIEQENHSGYLILEYVPGETLSEWIKHKMLTMDEILSIGRQIAEAILAAHKKGIVHRDLKPGNIKITPDAQVKVLDFGLAKPFAKQDKKKEITETQPGRVIGTPAYMSPEQARGKNTDHRTDIWSFGCMMYQILCGRLPFEGETATDTLARIIEREPDWEMLPEETPSNIRMLLRRCLEKDPDKRLDNITDATTQISDTLCRPIPAPAVSSRLRRAMWMMGTAIIVALLAITLRLLPEKQAQLSSKGIRLVVMPFENLGSAEDEYFATGLTDGVTTRLAGIHGLRVYKNRDQVPRQIIEELGVAYILKGTLQRVQRFDPNSPMRIRVEIIRASNNSLVWDFSLDNVREILTVQSDLVEGVTQALGITLLEQERHALETKPIEDAEAYDYYLRGEHYIVQIDLESRREIAINQYKKAIELDPNLAPAHAALSMIYTGMYWDRTDRSEKRLAMAEEAARRAVELDPDLPEAHIALARYYGNGQLRFDIALDHLANARERDPDHERMLYWTGNFQRRKGKFELAIENLKKACVLNPITFNYPSEIGLNYLLIRKYKESEHFYDKAMLLTPQRAARYTSKAWLYLVSEGDTDKARSVLEEGLKIVKPTKHSSIINHLVMIDMYEDKYQDALERLALKSENLDRLDYFLPYALRCALIFMHMDNEELAEINFEDARIILEDKIKQEPEDDRYYSALGITYAGLGRKQDAIDMGQQGTEKLLFSEDGSRAQSRHEDLARIYVMNGDLNAAIGKLEFLLNMPGDLSISLLSLDPAWKPLRGHPRFRNLIAQGK